MSQVPFNIILYSIFNVLLLCSTDNVKVGPDGSVITITNARPMDHGAYRCVASNPFGITHTIVSLIVKGKPEFSLLTPIELSVKGSI